MMGLSRIRRIKPKKIYYYINTRGGTRRTISSNALVVFKVAIFFSLLFIFLFSHSFIRSFGIPSNSSINRKPIPRYYSSIILTFVRNTGWHSCLGIIIIIHRANDIDNRKSARTSSVWCNETKKKKCEQKRNISCICSDRIRTHTFPGGWIKFPKQRCTVGSIIYFFILFFFNLTGYFLNVKDKNCST